MQKWMIVYTARCAALEKLAAVLANYLPYVVPCETAPREGFHTVTLAVDPAMEGFSIDVTEPGEYELKFNSGVGETTETITVSRRGGTGFSPVSVTMEDYTSMLSPEKLSEAAQALGSAVAARPEREHMVYGVDAMRAPVSGKELAYRFDDLVNIGNAEISGDAGNLLVNGSVYSVAAGTQVRSAQAGEVVFAGELAPTGKTVVIYHGSGIYTYYFHLDSVNVENGYTLNSGEIIGTSGSTGFTDGKELLHFSVSIDGHFVDPAIFVK